jgi:hypothetical protein
MTVAAQIDLGMSGRSAPGHGQARALGGAKGLGTGWAGTPAANSPSSSAPGAESFRSGWQSLLASMSADRNTLIEREQAADGMQAQTESVLTGSPGETSRPASPPAEAPALSLVQPGTPPEKPAAIATQLHLALRQAAMPAWVAPAASLRVAPDSRAKSPSIASSEGSPRGNRATRPERRPEEKAARVVDGSPLAFATIVNVPRAIVTLPGAAAPVEIAAQQASSLPLAHVAHSLPTAPLLDSFNRHPQHAVLRGATAGSLSPAEIQASGATGEPGVAHAAPPAGFNDRVESTADAEVHAPNMATRSAAARSLSPDDPHVFAGERSEAASPLAEKGTRAAALSPARPAGFDAHSEATTDDSSPQTETATRAREVHPTIPLGSSESVGGTGRASDLAVDPAGSAAARSFNQDYRVSTPGLGLASLSRDATGGAIPAQLVGASPSPSTNPSVPVRASRPSVPLGPANLAPSTEPQPRLTGDPVQSSVEMGTRPEESLESSSQARIPIQPRISGPEVETVSPPVAADWLGQTSAIQARAPFQPAPVAPTVPPVGKAGLATDEANRTSLTSLRAGRAAGPAAQGNDRPGGQIAGPATDPYPQMRDLAAANMPSSPAGGTIGDSAAGSSTPSDHEPFAALDGGPANPLPTWLHAGAQRAEAGFHDPALGWIGVRADSTSGGVHASLVPDSAVAAQALGGHMTGLNAYLVEQRTPVETLTVAPPDNRSISSAMDQSGHRGMHQGAGQDSGQGGHSEAPSHTRQSATAVTGTASSIEAAPAGGRDRSAPAGVLEGLHISVMA